MRIGYDTLIENPLNPSSAIDYLRNLLGALAGLLGDLHELFVFVSPKNRRLFDLALPRVRLVNCFVSNEHIPLRILVQQLYYPLLARRHRLDVIFGLNQAPLLAPCATVVKTCSLHHHVTPEEFGTPTAKRWKTWENRLRIWYRRQMFDASARRSTLVVANSEWSRNAIVEMMGLSSRKVRVVYEAVDDRFGSLDPETAARAVREQFGLQRPYVLYVSNLWFYKNPDGAIRAFARMRDKYGADLDLVIAGPDDLHRLPQLTTLAREWAVEDRVRFLGRLTTAQLVPLYAAARAVLYPSLAETFGKPVVEAMRSGVPLVAARATCLPEIVGEAGLLADPSDEDALAEMLHRAVSDQPLRRRLVELGQLRSGRFSWADSAQGTLQACLEAAAIRSGRVPLLQETPLAAGGRES
jgi:glycosyltransferase involved in cell wall biosynthesis